MEEYQKIENRREDRAYFAHENGITEIDWDYETKAPTPEKKPNKTKSSRLIIIAFEAER